MVFMFITVISTNLPHIFLSYNNGQQACLW